MASLAPLFSWRSGVSQSGLTPNTRHVALVLSLHMNELGGSCFPSLTTLASETGRARKTIVAALSELEDEGWLRVVHGGGRGRPNHYTATVPETVSRGNSLDPETVSSGPVKSFPGELEDVLHRGNAVAKATARALVSDPSFDGQVNGHPNQAKSNPNPAQSEQFKRLFERVEACVQRAPSARSHRAGFVKLVRELQEAGWTPEQVESRATAYRAHPVLGKTMLSLAALAKWGETFDTKEDALDLARETDAWLRAEHPDWLASPEEAAEIRRLLAPKEPFA